ncbi:MAG: hypothetical protein WDO74_30485 [Pseudomonadota bacterium]
MQARWAGLDAERKLAVQSDDGPLVESLPLLHLASGGRSARALYALATTSAGSQELAGILGIEHEPAAHHPGLRTRGDRARAGEARRARLLA